MPVDERASVRAALLEGWRLLDDDDRALVSALACGASYDTLVEMSPRFKHKVAVTRAVERVNRLLLGPLLAAEGRGGMPGAAPPARLLEAALDLLSELIPLDGPLGQ